MAEDEREGELFDIVDRDGRVIGQAPRRRCHGDPSLRHRAVHVIVFDRAGRLYLQKRSALKDTAPGLWDTSVGGHVQPGEEISAAARREFREEMGAEPGLFHPAYQYEWATPIETELITAFATLHEGPFRHPADEIEEGRFWTAEEIEAHRSGGWFTPQFNKEYDRMRAWWFRHAPRPPEERD